MIVRGGEERGIEEQAEDDAGIAPEHTVDEKAKNEFLRHRGNDHCQDDDHHSLLNRLRAVEKIDNLLPARAAAEKTLGDRSREHDKRRGREQKDDAGTDRALQARFRETAQGLKVDAAKFQ